MNIWMGSFPRVLPLVVQISNALATSIVGYHPPFRGDRIVMVQRDSSMNVLVMK